MGKDPLEQIRKGDPWYSADQILAAARPGTRRVIAHRIEFILTSIQEWRDTTCESGDTYLPLRILDAGCGDGVYLKILTQLDGFEVYGVDYNPLRVEKAKENVPSAIVIEGDLTNLDFESGFYHIILLSQGLEHITEDGAVLKSLARILNNKGILILGVTNEGCFLARLRNNYLERRISKTTDHVHFYTEATIAMKIAWAGLSIDKVMREGLFTPHQSLHAWLYSRDLSFKLMQFMGRLLKSQVAGFYFICRRTA